MVQQGIFINKKVKIFILLKLVLFVILYLVAQLLSSIVITMVFNKFNLKLEQNLTLPMVCVILSQALFFIVYINLFNRFIFKQLEPEIDEGNKNNRIVLFLKGLCFGMGIMIAIISLRGIFGTILEFDFYNIKTVLFLVIGNLIITFSAAVLEEYLFRFTLYSCLKRIFISKFWPLIIVSILFSCIHIRDDIAIIDLLFYLLFSIFLCMIIDIKKSLWMAIGFHTGWNYIADGGKIFKIVYIQETVTQILTLKIIILVGIIISIIGLYIIEKNSIRREGKCILKK